MRENLTLQFKVPFSLTVQAVPSGLCTLRELTALLEHRGELVRAALPRRDRVLQLLALTVHLALRRDQIILEPLRTR